MLYDSSIKIILLGDINQNINGGGMWFENLKADELKNISHRCPDNNCKWIRDNLNIDIYGTNTESEFKIISYENVLDYDNEKRTLLYSANSGNNNKNIINNWKGPKDTIKSAKGRTIDNDIIIIGNSINKKNYYTAITRSTKNVYSTITKITKN